MKVVTHNTIDGTPVRTLIESLVEKSLREYVETVEVSFTPTRAELEPGVDNLRRVFSVWTERDRRIRVFMWPILHWLRFHNNEDSVRYQAWEDLAHSVVRGFGAASIEMIHPRPADDDAELAVRRFVRQTMLEGEFNGLLTPPRNMGLIDKHISDWIRKALNEGRGRPFSQSGLLVNFYRELTMRKLGVHHTVSKVVYKLEYPRDDIGDLRIGMDKIDKNGFPWNGENGERYESGFLDYCDSFITRRRTIRNLAEEMGLGKLYVDRAKRTYLYLPHSDYAALLNVLFYQDN